MVLRQLPTKDAFEKADIVRESVEKAKEAVEMDIADGNSWGEFLAKTFNPNLSEFLL